MLRRYTHIAILSTVIALLASCSDESYYITPDEVPEEADGKPVEFILDFPEIQGSRTYIDGYGNERFSVGDLIHIIGYFNISYLDESSTEGNKITGTMSTYGALKFNGTNWVAADESQLTWPAVAVDGQFTAYYISESNGVLTGQNPTETYSLSNLTSTSDPLMAVSAEGIPYGYAVRLSFKHLCASLTLVDLEPQVSDFYWFTTNGPTDQDSGDTLPFNNAFRISLGQDSDENPTLNFEFCQLENSPYTGIFIEGTAEEYETLNDKGETVTYISASYFLEPGFYDTFQIVYPASNATTYPYIEYDYNNIPPNVGGLEIKNTPPDLQPNTPYTLTISKSPGITLTAPPAVDDWDESNNFYDVNVEDFLQAIYNKQEYTNSEGYQILEQTATGTKLLHNVDFHGFRYSEFTNTEFRPNNQEGSVFDGDFHYIQNLADPLFRYNFGTIQNLGIKKIDASLLSYEVEYADDNDMSRNGALCMWNRSDATISNIRISDANLTVYVKCVDPNGSEVHNIGMLVGSNTGNINTVSYSGTFNLTVSGLQATAPDYGDGNNYPVDASVLIGGIVGQNAAEGSISDVSPLDGSTMTMYITNNCNGQLGSYSVGGIVGESSGYILDVMMSNLRIDGSGSKGVTSYMGGMAGQLTTTGSSSINTCNVSGNVTAGVSVPYQTVTSLSYIGGIAGNVYNVPVVNCGAMVSVSGVSNTTENVLYGTGGAFGRISPAPAYSITDNTAYGTMMRYPVTSGGTPSNSNFYGSFAGIVPVGQSWDDNYKNNGNTVNPFPSMNYIGGYLNGNTVP